MKRKQRDFMQKFLDTVFPMTQPLINTEIIKF